MPPSAEGGLDLVGAESAGWTDTDVREVLLSTLRLFDRVNSGDGTGGDEVSLRGLSWIVTDAAPGSRSRSRFRVARSPPGRSSCRPTS